MIVIGSGAEVLSVTVIDVLLAGVVRPLFTRGKTPTCVRPVPHRERAVKIAHRNKFVSSLTGARIWRWARIRRVHGALRGGHNS
jgi:hypothetical protein